MKNKKTVISLLSVIAILFSAFGFSVTAQEKLPVEIKAKSAVLMDCDTGKVLMKYNEHELLPPASVTKIMPMILCAEAIESGKISLSDKVTASSVAASKGGSQIWLKEGEVMTVDELLKAVTVASANDACAALGEFICGSEEAFVDKMNEKAKQLLMKDTKFVNCSGLDDEDTNITSAYDIALMSAELMKHELIMKYTTIWMDSLRNGETQLVNTNKLIRLYKGATGLKTGTTGKAGCCLSATAKRQGLHLCAVVMGSDNSNDRFESAKAMLNWGFSNFAKVTPVIERELITPVNVLNGEKRSVLPVIPEISPIIIQKGKEGELKQSVSLNVEVAAPVEKNQILGTVTFTLGKEKVASYDLLSPEEIPAVTLKFTFCRLLEMLI